jgi:dTMP kinase
LQPGLFLTFEGPEGSGKSSQIETVARKIRDQGRKVLVCRAPGGTPVGESIRGILQHDTAGVSPVARSEALLFFASHAQLAETVIVPALDVGTVVLGDRYIDSTVAYQGYARGLGADVMRWMGEFAVNNVLPAKTILLDLDIGLGFSRIKHPLDRMESESREFHELMRRSYLSMAMSDSRWSIIDASQKSQVVARHIWEVVEPLL